MISSRRFKSTSRPRCRYLVISGLLTSVMVINSGVVVASTKVPSRQKGTLLQQGRAYYAGKTIEFIAPASVGSGTDIEARALAVSMSNYLHASINVVDISTGGTIAGQDTLAASQPNGLTIGTYTLTTDYYDLITKAPATNFNPEHEVVLGGLPNNDSVIMTQSASNVSSFSSLLNATQANPVKVLVNNGLGALTFRLMGRALGLNLQFIPYANSAALVQGFIRGDSSIATSSIAPVLPYITSGQARVVATTRLSRSTPANDLTYSIVHNAPDIPQLLKQYPPKTALEQRAAKFLSGFAGVLDIVYGAPTKTPPAEVAALTAALKFGLNDPATHTIFTSQGKSNAYIAPSVIKSDYATALKHAANISSSLGY